MQYCQDVYREVSARNRICQKALARADIAQVNPPMYFRTMDAFLHEPSIFQSLITIAITQVIEISEISFPFPPPPPPYVYHGVQCGCAALL